MSLPPGRCGFTFEAHAVARPRPTAAAASCRGNRNLSYTTNARIVSSSITARGDGYVRV